MPSRSKTWVRPVVGDPARGPAASRGTAPSTTLPSHPRHRPPPPPARVADAAGPAVDTPMPRRSGRRGQHGGTGLPRRLPHVTLSPARRRRIDRIVAGVIALAVLALATVVYLTSDVRATTDATGPEVPAPSAAASVPTSLTEKWSVATDPAIGAVASPYGVVVTAQGTAAVAFDAVTGERRWS